MKTKQLCASLLFMVALMAASAFAAGKETVETQQTVTVNGTQLPAGTYTVTWEGHGPGVSLKFLKGKNVVATVPAQIVNQKTAVMGGVVVEHQNDHLALTEIRPSGKKYVLDIGGDAVQTAAENGSK